MTRALLTLDLGNSRHKLRLWRAPSAGPREGALPELVRGLDLEGGADEAERLARFLDALEPGLRVAASSVAGAERERALADALRARGLEPRTPVHGLALEVDEPHGVGLDRLFAARGALALLGRSALVVDLGTALTVDALALDARGPRFLGGAIAPGPAPWARALREGTARLPDFEPRPDAPARGRSTRAALQAGLAHGLRGAVEELVAALARECALQDAPVALCGGAARFAAPEGACTLAGHELVREPELVHLGLWAASEG